MTARVWITDLPLTTIDRERAAIHVAEFLAWWDEAGRWYYGPTRRECDEGLQGIAADAIDIAGGLALARVIAPGLTEEDAQMAHEGAVEETVEAQTPETAGAELSFRKRSIVIQAAQFLPETNQPWPFGVVNFGVPKADGELSASSLDGKYWLQTLEGPLIVVSGDWIIRGIAGEYYPCKPEIFAALYDLDIPPPAPPIAPVAPPRLRRKDADTLENKFTYHRPFGDQPERYIRLRTFGKLMAEVVEENVLPSRERSLALTRIEEAVFWANAAIARNEAEPTQATDTQSDR